MKQFHKKTILPLVALTGVLFSSAVAGGTQKLATNLPGEQGIRPEYLLGQEVITYYDGTDNDLLTAGLGTKGLNGPEPAPQDPLNPTDEELRRLTIYTNFRALVDVTEAGGYGRLYGPKGEGKVAGHEYLVMGEVDGLNHPVTFMVQVPDHFDPEDPCLITAPSSGGRTVYGAVGTVGSWALPKGCAVAYTDKATGIGVQYLRDHQGHDMRGRLISLDENKELPFRLAMNESLKAFIKDHPQHVALKHAHSRDNSQKDWGRIVLNSIDVAFYILNKHHRAQEDAPRYTRDTVLVIASSISNGGYSSLKALEADREGLIDGLVVSEPNVMPDMATAPSVVIESAGEVLESPGQSFLDYASRMNVLLPCAFVLEPMTNPLKALIPTGQEALENRCRTLAAHDIVTGETVEDMARDAREQLRAYGILDETRLLDGFSVFAEIWPSVVTDYTLAYGRYGVEDNLCGIGIAPADQQGVVTSYSDIQKHTNFAKSSGMIPNNGLYWVKKAGDGWKRSLYVPNPENGLLDLDGAGALCLDELVRDNPAVARGKQEVKNSGDLGGRPAIIIHGRMDNLIHVNHASRPYYALNKLREGEKSALRYYEVRHGQHFDSLPMFPVYAPHLVPLHYYLEQGLELMWDHLKSGRALPPSQVIPSVPRGINEKGTIPPLDQRNVPPILEKPGKNAITFDGGRLMIPE
ncbi:3-hydroxybutyrate oligomer hydrolase family protein [Luteithermobacter gelatinilyticus]|uniref:3-hydroxybutyrate oligomer hydrolase family protein n=1 Tax=Luteithermobacter gelatinilyticus TaxID=2582913 RepID=UPI001105DB09|nr:3-hydroxybutyrate oligomer hydrolase family protein [Luteithermobacter gelatinilyticus]